MLFGQFRPNNSNDDSSAQPPGDGGEPLSEDMALLLWRLSQFERLGCSHVEAIELAAAGADWHQLQRLLSKGCRLSVAVEILS